MTERWSEHEMLELAARGIGKVDRLGTRGITGVTHEEIAAMATVLAILGVVPVPPGGRAPDRLLITESEGDER